MAGYPRADQEPMLRIKASFYGDGGGTTKSQPGQGWVVLSWTEHRPDAVDVWGPFRTQTEAREFGRKRSPRRYQVSGLRDPNGSLRLYGYRYPDREADTKPK